MQNTRRRHYGCLYSLFPPVGVSGANKPSKEVSIPSFRRVYKQGGVACVRPGVRLPSPQERLDLRRGFGATVVYSSPSHSVSRCEGGASTTPEEVASW